MKILFVCQQYIHSARWINQLKNAGHEIYVFDCLDIPIHKDLLWTNFITNWSKRKLPYIKGEHFLKKKFPVFYKNIEPFLKVTPSEKLLKIIKDIQPDLVHSLEMQSQTYHVIKSKSKVNFKWAYFSWGSDLYLYQNQKRDREKMQKIFSKLNYLFVDNNRDIQLAKNLGFKNEVAGVYPGGGGYNLEEYKEYSMPILERNLILIKGYEHWAGKALKVLEAIELIVNEVENYEIYVYSAHDKVIDKIKELNQKHQVNIEYSSRDNEISHTALLQKFGAAKIAIGNSISDGIPNTLLEAIILGAFPIQSNPGGASEDYIKEGVNGFLIQDPENSKQIAEKILNALENNSLLENAFIKNKMLAEQLDYKLIQEKVVETYNQIEMEL
jgi:hypothetical protein